MVAWLHGHIGTPVLCLCREFAQAAKPLMQSTYGERPVAELEPNDFNHGWTLMHTDFEQKLTTGTRNTGVKEGRAGRLVAGK